MDIKYLRRSTPVDTDDITIINGMGESTSKVKTRLGRTSSRSEGELSKSPDSPENTDVYVTDWAKDEDSDESDPLSPKEKSEKERREKVEELQKKHDDIWAETLNNKKRIISQGDLKFDLGQN